MSSIEIRQFGCRSDNFGVLVHDRESGTTLSIDAPEEGPIVRALEQAGWSLTHILTTHHHGDHVAANEALKARYDAAVIGPEKERAKIPGLDKAVAGGETLDVGGIRVETIDTPGHTLGRDLLLPARGKGGVRGRCACSRSAAAGCSRAMRRCCGSR